MTKLKIQTLVLFTAVFWSTLTLGQSADEIVKKVEKKYQSIKTFSAEFEEIFTWTLAKESRSFQGRFFIKKPDRFRLETEKQVISSDGETVWRYAIPDSQVFVTDAESDPDFPLLKDLLFDYVENYSHVLLGQEKLDDAECFHVKLIPKEEDSYMTEMMVWIDSKEWFTRKVEYTDIQGNITTYKLSEIKKNKKIDDDIFAFTIPEGVEVIETR